MFTYLFDGFHRRVFSLLRAGGILYIYIALSWRHRSTCPRFFSFSSPVISAVVSVYLITSTTVPQIPVLVLRPEFGTRFAPSVHDDISLRNWYSLPLFMLTEEGATSALGFWPLISLFLSFPGDSLGLLSLSPGHRVQTSVGFHSNLDLLLRPKGLT